MRNIIFLVSILAMFLYLTPAVAEGGKDSQVVEITVKPMLEVERKMVAVEIIPGDSEYTKRETAKNESDSRTVVSRDRTESVPEASYDLEGLRSLYREAATKFGIDWKLIEAVHQVETGKSTDTCIQSYAGATGPMQFLPSTFRHYANEGDNICGLRDAVFAGANLLASGGADEGDIDSALFNYNHSLSYVELVKSVMNSI